MLSTPRASGLYGLGASPIVRVWASLLALALVGASVPIFASLPFPAGVGAFGMAWAALTFVRGAWLVGLRLTPSHLEMRTMYRRLRLERAGVTLLRVSLTPLELVVAQGEAWTLFRAVGRPGLTRRARGRYGARLATLAQALDVPLETVGPHDPLPEGVSVTRAERLGERHRVVGWPFGAALGVALLVTFL